MQKSRRPIHTKWHTLCPQNYCLYALEDFTESPCCLLRLWAHASVHVNSAIVTCVFFVFTCCLHAFNVYHFEALTYVFGLHVGQHSQTCANFSNVMPKTSCTCSRSLHVVMTFLRCIFHNVRDNVWRTTRSNKSLGVYFFFNFSCSSISFFSSFYVTFQRFFLHVYDGYMLLVQCTLNIVHITSRHVNILYLTVTYNKHINTVLSWRVSYFIN